ncbi:multimeric flavodoxin WrbA [Tritrichomonas foetus]|uniref:Multimeric flavodoxin WrbA n=1 Tax=Tritrichomonas foetus TaxID=1144522 RepID=A0A1J4KA22_9EUKA|nr:multimeric flavodoxin WrbA [Tritrichomonas foetus]|eukprot:OHT08075.1 multimeric flavodoxin WrbA [Tritrichomonas foetus]
MLKRVIGINGSPRKGWNTDLLVQKVLEGAKQAGAETKLIQISSFKNVNPCQSCLVCKKGKGYEGHCTIKDDLTPVLEEIKQNADALVIGSPIYWGLPSAAIHNLLERLWFSSYAYRKENPNVLGKTLPTAYVWTMNVPKDVSDMMYTSLYNHVDRVTNMIFGRCEMMHAYNTTQVKDYSKYDMSIFDPEVKKKARETQFPKDLQQAFELGQKLVK